MISIIDKAQCCGCSACVEICPRKCISFKRDAEGFLYPEVDKSACTDCHLCEKVCPVLNPNEERQPRRTYAAINNDIETRKNSSSGGVFYLLAKKIIDQGGVVFGARFNVQWEVIMDYTETLSGILNFMGSKYVQADPRNTFAEVKQFLQAGRKVLFTGTFCQIAGLRHFLRKDYDNLFLVDVICHGAPSPAIWQKYLLELESHGKSSVKSRKSVPFIEGISFRDKSNGWKKYRFFVHLAEALAEGKKKSTVFSSIYTKPFYEDPYFALFLRNYSLRPSCYSCPAKKGKSGSDITIGDFWGIEKIMPEIDDDMGISAVLVNTLKGESLIADLNMSLYPCAYEDILAGNSMLEKSVPKPARRNVIFWKKHKSIAYLADYALERTIPFRIKRKAKAILRRCVKVVKPLLGDRGVKIGKAILGRE